MQTLSNLLVAVGAVLRPVNQPFRIGTALCLVGGLLTANLTAGPPPTNWSFLLPSRVLPATFGPEEFDVSYGNGTFVAVSGFGGMATSPNALNWNPVLTGTFDYFASVAFGGGVFVAVGGGVISTSTDGTDWNHFPGVGDNIQLFRIRYLDSLFVATGGEYLGNGDSAGVLYTSSDGQQWTQRLRIVTESSSYYGVYSAGIAHFDGRFVAPWQQLGTSSAKGLTYTSLDGLQWTLAPSNPLLVEPTEIAAGNVGFIVLDGRRILTTADGTNWQVLHELDASQSWSWDGIAVAGNRIVCLAQQPTEQDEAPRFSLTSTNGISWQQSPLPGGVFRRLFSYGTNFFALGSRSALTSPDGITWAEHFTPHPLDLGTAGLFDVAYADQGFVAVGQQGTIITSLDAISWQKRASGTTQDLGAVIHGEGRYVAAGSRGTLVHSTNGHAWSPVDLDGVTLPLGPIAYGGGRFVLITRVGGNGFFWTSEDGADWSLRFANALNFFHGISSMAYGNGRFVVTGNHSDANGYHNDAAVSVDGITWQRAVLPAPYTTMTFHTLIFDGERFLALLDFFGLAASADGLSWTTIDEGDYYAIGHGNDDLVAVRGTSENTYGDVISLLESSVNGTSWETVAPFVFGSRPLKFAYGTGRFVGVGSWFEHTRPAMLLVSDFPPPLLLPQLEIRSTGAQFILRMRGAAGSTWSLQQSSALTGWQTLHPVTLDVEPLEVEVSPTTNGQGFWRLTAP